MTPDRKTATIRRMEPRRVVVIAEIITDVPVKDLRRADGLGLYVPSADGVVTCHAISLEQLQVNVVDSKPAKAKRRTK